MPEKITQTLFPTPVPCLYVGSMQEHHGDGMVFGPMVDGCYRVNISEELVLITKHRDSFVVND